VDFKNIVESIGADYIKLKNIFEVRWLSMGESIKAVIKNYEAILKITEKDSDEGEPVAIGLHKQMTSYLFAALFHLASDVFDAVNSLSKTLQVQDVCFAHVQRGVIIHLALDHASYTAIPLVTGFQYHCFTSSFLGE
jgi:hypothetical protein